MTDTPEPQETRQERVGVIVRCLVCGNAKKPIGRSASLGAPDECPGYRQSPYPGSLWPDETESDFGYPVGNDGTELRDLPSPQEPDWALPEEQETP